MCTYRRVRSRGRRRGRGTRRTAGVLEEAARSGRRLRIACVDLRAVPVDVAVLISGRVRRDFVRLVAVIVCYLDRIRALPVLNLIVNAHAARLERHLDDGPVPIFISLQANLALERVLLRVAGHVDVLKDALAVHLKVGGVGLLVELLASPVLQLGNNGASFGLTVAERNRLHF